MTDEIVLAGKDDQRRAQLREDVFRRSELLGFGEMCHVAGVYDELRLVRQRVDSVDRRLQGGGDVGICLLVKADVTIANLHEIDRPRDAARQGGTGHESAGAHRVGDPRSGPGDMSEKIFSLHQCMPRAARTTIVPFMYGCSEQKYGYFPGLVIRTVH